MENARGNSWRKLVNRVDRAPTTRTNEETPGRRRLSLRQRGTETPVTSPTNTSKQAAPSRRPPTPSKSSGSANSRRGSLLVRFLQSTGRRRSLTGAVSGEGSTISRMTDDSTPLDRETTIVRRNTCDGGEVSFFDGDEKNGDANKNNKDILSELKSPGGKPGFRKSPLSLMRPIQSFRRATMDMGKSSSSPRRISSLQVRPSPVTGLNIPLLPGGVDSGHYQDMQSRLQRRADELHKGGKVEESIKVWYESLTLAEHNQETLTVKTELLCTLVDLHLQASRQYASKETYGYEDAGPSSNNATQEDNDRQVAYHKQAAKRFVYRIKPTVVNAQWLTCSRETMEFFYEAEAWELATIVADQLNIQESMEPERLAKLHYQVATIKLNSGRQGEALQHLQATVKQLQNVSDKHRDDDLYLRVLKLLANEYESQSQHELALEAHEVQLECAPKEIQSSIYCHMAQAYISMQKLDKALEQLELASSNLRYADSTIRLHLLQTKGDLYSRVGRVEESYAVYRQALKEVVNPAEKAKLLYTTGRICVRLKLYREAISYYTKEMEITASELGENHLAVSRVLHEVAKIYDECLGEQKLALNKLNKALSIELSVLQRCHSSIIQCKKCNSDTHRMCVMHGNMERDISSQVRETKKAQGRLHFKLGDFERAMQIQQL